VLASSLYNGNREGTLIGNPEITEGQRGDILPVHWTSRNNQWGRKGTEPSPNTKVAKSIGKTLRSKESFKGTRSRNNAAPDFQSIIHGKKT